nr:unnamed protein product [Digitaria exilis]
MEFWGLEVKPGSTVKCVPGDGYILHLSQAALGESKKSDNALMYVQVDDQKLAIGTLSPDKYPQIQFDLVFDKEFELSHTSKAASVFFSEEELNVPVIKENGKAEGKNSQGKPVAAVKEAEKKSKEDDSDEDETDDSSDDEGLSPEEGDDDSSDEGDSSDEDDDESEEDEDEETPTPKKPEVGKKRAADNALKTPLSDKKAKATPSGQKTGGNKATAHVATPHPAKGTKTPANNASKEKSPRSGGSVSCKSCSKTFNSDMALQAHSKAKHGAK